jgi:hypothetical protein
MWIQFPKGCERINVELQTFETEMTDEAGNNYFRAPDHFVPRILNIGGFRALDKAPEGFPADLPQADPLRDGAITNLTQENQSLKTQVQNLTEDLTSSHAQIRSLIGEVEALRKQVEMRDERIVTLEEVLEDKGKDVPSGPTTPAPAASSTTYRPKK